MNLRVVDVIRLLRGELVSEDRWDEIRQESAPLLAERCSACGTPLAIADATDVCDACVRIQRDAREHRLTWRR